MNVKRLVINICSENLGESKAFYQKLFDFEPAYDSDWFINLVSQDKSVELGIIARTHEIVPPKAQKVPQGTYLTFVVEDVDALHKLAQQEGFKILEPPQDTFYGQRRLLLEDPDGLVVDISAPIPDFGL